MIKDEVYYNPKTNEILILATLGCGFFLVKDSRDTYIIQGKVLNKLVPKKVKVKQLIYIGDL